MCVVAQAKALQEVAQGDQPNSTAQRIQLDVTLAAPHIIVPLQDGSSGNSLSCRLGVVCQCVCVIPALAAFFGDLGKVKLKNKFIGIADEKGDIVMTDSLVPAVVDQMHIKVTSLSFHR